MRFAAFSFATLVVLSCTQPPERDARGSNPAASSDKSTESEWQSRLIKAPDRFRPGGWSDEQTLWGLTRSRLTRFNVETGEARSLGATAWSIHSARGVVSWRNEQGTWMLRDNGSPLLLAGPGIDSASGFEGPPSILWSADGRRALLGWQGEWDAQYVFLHADSARRRVETRLRGYFGNAAVLWLDSTRVLFQTVATGPVGKEPSYRESGWRGDLAVLDLAAGSYSRVTSVPDFVFLRVAGPFNGDVLVSEWDSGGRATYWGYNSLTWERKRVDLPAGRAFAADGGAVVIFADVGADSSRAILQSGASGRELGVTSRDAVPVFSPSGRRGALLTRDGVVIMDTRR